MDTHPSPIDIAPSSLSADFSWLGEQVRAALGTGIHRIYVDVMDGRFVPTITIRPLVVQALRLLADAFHSTGVP